MSELIDVGNAVLQFLGDNAKPLAGGAAAVAAVKQGSELIVSAVRNLAPVLNRHYEGTSLEARAKALENSVSVSARVRDTIDDYIEGGRLTVDQGRLSFADPSFATFFRDGITYASETSSEMEHIAFAALVVERMVSGQGKTASLLLRTAASKLRELGDRQLRLLGLVFVAEHVMPDPIDKRDNADSRIAIYLDNCEREMRPFWDFEILDQDLEHLQALSLLVRSERRFLNDFRLGIRSPMLNGLNEAVGVPEAFHLPQHAVLSKLREWMNGPNGDRTIALTYHELTTTGIILGNVVSSHLRGVPLDLGEWK